MQAPDRRTLIVIDDSRINREILSDVFSEKYSVLIAADGAEGLALLRENRGAAAVLLDLAMPNMDGFEFLEKVKTDPMLSAVPVIVTTQFGEEENELRALKLGATDFITKPYSREMVFQRVENVISIIGIGRGRDKLTGIPRFASFLDETGVMLRASNSSDRYVMVYWNVERFKVVNDLFGSDTGDRLLMDTALGLEKYLRGRGTYCRMEADRFAFCCPESMFDPQKVLGYVELTFAKYNLKYNLIVLLGIYQIEDKNMQVAQMVDRAHMAATTVKGNYVRRFAYYDEALRDQLLVEQEITSEMDSALREGQFEIFLQPVYSISSGRPISAEALVRWRHPVKGMISPGVFIPLFERNGFITRLDEYVWDKVFGILEVLRANGIEDFPISANVSRMDIYNPSICGDILETARRHGVPPSLFRLEITESAYMDNPRQLQGAITQFRQMGFSVLMDDFGSGYSSLNMIMDVPVDALKIDMKFVSSIGASERSNSVINSVVRMAKWLEMSVIAEGVETAEQLEYLRSVGCDSIQGFYFAKPMPVKDFFTLLENTAEGREQPLEAGPGADVETLWTAVNDARSGVARVTGAAGLYELFGSMLEIIRVNDEYYKLMESSPAIFTKATKDALAWVVEGDRAQLMETLAAAKKESPQHTTVRRYVSGGRYKTLSLSVIYAGCKDNRLIYLITGYECPGAVQHGQMPIDRPEARVRLETEKRGAKPVLVVDDNQVNRAALLKLLSDDYEIIEAENGRQAIKRMYERPDIAAVLLDLTMPVMDGCEFLRYRRREPRFMGAPVLALSQIEEEDSGAELKALSLGAYDIVKKPYEGAVLRQRLANMITLGALMSENSASEAVMAATRSGVCVVTEKSGDTDMLYVSEGLALPLGLEVDEFKRRFSAMETWGVQEDDLEDVRRRLNSGAKSVDTVLRVAARDGGWVWLSAAISEYESEGERRLFFVVLTDDTQKTLQKLRYDALLESLPGGALIYSIKDGALKLESASAGADRACGLEPGGLKASGAAFYGVSEEDAWALERNIISAVQDGKKTALEYRVKKPDGSAQAMRLFASPLQQSMGAGCCAVLLPCDSL